MQVNTLQLPEQIRGATHVAIVTFADLNDTAALTKTLSVFTAASLPAGTLLDCVGYRVVTAFAGGTVATLTVQVGDTGSANRYATAGLKDLLSTGAIAVPKSVTTAPFALTSADTVKLLFTSTVGNLSALTAGEIHIFLRVVDTREWSNVPA